MVPPFNSGSPAWARPLSTIHSRTTSPRWVPTIAVTAGSATGNPSRSTAGTDCGAKNATQSVPAVDLLGFPVALPAVTAMVGTHLGLVVLLWMVLRGRAHAGLPLLNGGTIAGYLVGALVGGLSLVQALGLGPYV